MQIHIWQQFSSNHSASFTLVGKFASEEKAQDVEAILQEFFTSLATWLTNPPDPNYHTKRQASTDLTLPPTAPEIAFGKRFGIDWKIGINWSHDGMGWLYPFMRFRDMIIIRPTTPVTWQGFTPFDKILTKLGGEVAYRSDTCYQIPDSVLLVTFTFNATYESTADKIERYYEDAFLVQHAGDTSDLISNHLPFMLHEEVVQAGVRHFELERNGLMFTLHGISFSSDIIEGFHAILSYLRSKDCYNINYTFQTIPIDPKD